MAKKKLDILQKLSTVTAAMGNIIDSLTGNSSTDAPSIRAVNEALDNTKNQLLTGYEESTGNSYSGSASDYGIEIAKASGNYEQEGTPTPESPIEPKFFEPKHVNTNGGNLFDASKIPTNTKNNVTVINNDDGSFTINGNGTVPAQTSFGTCTIRNLKKGTLYIKSDAYVYPYLYVDIYWGDVWKKVATNASSLLTTIEITQEDIDNGAEARVYFKANSAQSIKTGTVQPVIYQDGDGTWYPFNADSTPLSLTLRALPNGVKDTYENGVITRRVGYIEFDGSSDEYWVLNRDINVRYQFVFTNAIATNPAYETINFNKNNGISNIGIGVDASSQQPYEGIWLYNNTTAVISISNSLISEYSVEAFKSWLQLNKVKLWYQLEEPYTEQVDLPVIPSYFPYTNAWHDSEVEASDLTWHILSAINGIVTNDWGTENLDKKAPSIQSVLDNLRPKQLLKNPDFQVNQRGQSEYNFATNGTYGLDMWQHRQGKYLGALIVTPIKGGGVHIKLGANSGGGLRQVLNGDDFKIGQPYTAVVSINNTQYKGTLNLSNVAQKFIENELFQLEIGIIEGNFNYSLWVKQTGFEGDINYCDLWEGDIAYPHVKKSYQDDLWECMKYVQKLESRVVPLNKIWGNQRNSVLIAYIAVCRTMVSKPTIEVNWSSWIYSSNDSDGHDVPTENCNFTFRVLNNEIDIRITKKDGTSFNKNYDYFVNTGNDGILLSCELL